MDLILALPVVAGLFVLVGLSEPLADRLRLPGNVILAAIGIALAAGATWFLYTPLTNVLNPVAIAILTLPISSELFLYVFLPTLIFQVALSLNLRRMLDDWVPILMLAVVAVAVATAVIGAALFPVSGLPLMGCLLIGAIVSTTDPSAVVSIFRATPAPLRLARIVEGESLLNDAAAIALFGVFIEFVRIDVASPGLAEALARFPVSLIGGALVGLAMGRVCVALFARLSDYPVAQITISLALPYASFLLADKGLHASGVVAVVAAAMAVNLAAPGRMTPPALAKLHDTWDLLGYWAGSLIFVLAALLIPRLLADLRAFDLALIAVVVVAAFVARAIVLFGLLPLLTLARVSPRVDRPYRLAILWGGLRGAVTLALALAVTESPGVPPEVKRLVGILATGFTLFTLLVQGTTLRRAIRWLRLDRLSPLDAALSDQVVAVALQSVRETVAETTREFGLQKALVRDEAVRFGERLDRAVTRADAATGIPDRDRVTLGLVALAGRERDVILESFRDQLMAARLADRLLADADRLIEATRTAGRPGYRAQARRALMTGRALRLAEALHNRLRHSRPLERLTAERFDLVVSNGLILRQLHGFIDSRILRIHGRRVADLLHDLVTYREEDTQKELDGLRLQYPGHAEDLERRLIRRTTLQQEMREYDQLTQDGLIGPELRSVLMNDIARRRAILAASPPLDLALQKSELVRLFPLFEEMEAAARNRLAARLRTVYAAPGDVLLSREEMPRKVWFIASGAVEAVTASAKNRLGRGEMFGQLAVLLKAKRRVQVTAITHCTLLTLDDALFLTLARDNAALRKAVEGSAAQRGVAFDPNLFHSAAVARTRPFGVTLARAMRILP